MKLLKDCLGSIRKIRCGNEAVRSLGHSRMPRRALPGLLAPALFTLAPFGGLPREALAEDLFLEAYLGFLDKKPKAFRLTLPQLQVNHTDGTASYTVSAPRSSTGITLDIRVDRSSKVTVERYHAPGGKELKRKAWSSKRGSKRRHILSFDGLELGENTIRISLGEDGKGKRENIDVIVTRAAAFGSDATLTSLKLSESGLTPAFEREVKSYKASVLYRVTALGLGFSRKEATTVIQLRGIASDGTALAVKGRTVSGLTVGRNTIEILATAEDSSTTERYTVAVFRLEPSNDTTLDGLSLAEGAAGVFGLDIPSGGGILRPAFSRRTTSYEAGVPSNVTAVKMAISLNRTMALRPSGSAVDGTPLAVRMTSFTIEINKHELQRHIVTFAGLQVGRNRIEIHVTAEDGVTMGAYEVTVWRGSGPKP